ncbi:MAG: hypothetical protein JNM43_16115 [Planctomycetaceae bacterium]|nr:hypothetical protein [Planctomycetaceae bacterium]
MPQNAFIFECSSSTYLDCVEKNLFGSNKPWPLQIKAGDYCLLHHYEIGGLLGMWRATCDGEKNLAPKVWGGKFPYQVRVQLVLPKVTEVPSKLLATLGLDPAVGRCDNCLDEDLAEELIAGMKSLSGPDTKR